VGRSVRSKIAENMHEMEMSQLGPSGSLAAAAQQAPVAATAADGAATSALMTGQKQQRQAQEQAQQQLQQEQLPAPEGSAAASEQAPLSATAGAAEGAAASVPVTGQPQPPQQQQQPQLQHVAQLNASAGEQAVAAAAEGREALIGRGMQCCFLALTFTREGRASRETA